MRTKERKPIEQSVGEALASGKLTGEQLKKVTALGVVGITEKFADAVFRLKYGNDAKSYKGVLADMERLTKRLNAQRGWMLTRKLLAPMPKEVLDYWLADTCPACQGRGWKVVDGSPYLSDEPCLTCLDRPGKRPYPWVLAFPEIKIAEHEKPEKRKELRKKVVERERLLKRYKELLCKLEDDERHVGEKVIKALSGSVREMGRIFQEAAEE